MRTLSARILALLCVALLLGLGISSLLFQEEKNHAEQVPQESEKHAKASEKNTKDQPKKTPQKQEQKPEKKISEEELTNASSILAFFNTAEKNTSQSWCVQADHIAFFIRIYLGEWQLPKLPKIPISLSLFEKKLTPPKGLYGEEIESNIHKKIEILFDSLTDMIKKYKDLESYVLDPEIQDEGVRGKRLATSILNAYERFSRAKKEYFAILESKAVAAENLLVENHPLQRQILETRAIFSLFREISFELSKETIDRTRMLALEKELTAHLENAEKPPFKESPLVERVFRAFLKEVRNYQSQVVLGNAEGFYPNRRKLLNDALANCRSRYNAFAEYYNTKTEIQKTKEVRE